MKIIDDICSHMVSGYIKWTYEKCKEDAMKYNKRNDFKKKSNSAYNSARLNGWLEDICSHMKIRFVWTKELVKEEAKNYSSKSAFQKGSGVLIMLLKD